MLQVAKATFIRNTLVMLRAYPWSFVIGHILSGVYTVLFAFFAYHYVFAGQLDERFVQLSGSSDYLSYAILGGAFYAFAVSTLMNVSRSLITELQSVSVWRLRSYRLILFGQLISELGASLGTLASSWLIYQATGSEAAVGGMWLLYFLPSLALQLIIGPYLDRFDKKRVMVFSQWVRSGAFGLAVGAILIQPDALWPLYLISLINGLIQPLYVPASQSLLPSLVHSDSLVKAAVPTKIRLHGQFFICSHCMIAPPQSSRSESASDCVFAYTASKRHTRGIGQYLHTDHESYTRRFRKARRSPRRRRRRSGDIVWSGSHYICHSQYRTCRR